MDYHILFFVPWLVLMGIAISMVIQGWMIMGERAGYQKKPNYKSHPEISELKGDTGTLMTAKFDKLPDEDYKKLSERIHKLKMDELFDEPSTYEDEHLDDD
tara:strand:- start:612 stop:914 length:303 start_codon:yes stop_codon:yes gene_type:complete